VARSEEEVDKVDSASEEPSGRSESSRSAARSRAAAPAEPKKNPVARFIDFSHECWAELQRVQWPDRRQLWQATAVVIVVCVLVGVYIGALDRLFRPISGWLIDQYAKH
jgi:preprotein translocase SecE subunit